MRRFLGSFVLAGALAVLATLALAGLSSRSAGQPLAPSPRPGRPDPADEALARALCVGCHAFPPPEILPRRLWRGSVVNMELIRTGRDAPLGPGTQAPRLPNIELPPPLQRVLRYYEANAPEALPPAIAWPAVDAGPPRFARHLVTPPGAPPTPAVANVRLLDLDGDPRREVVISDMRHGMVLLGRPYDLGTGLEVLAHVPHPAHVQVTDLDRDGRRDLLVADLGDFFPADSEKGSVVWLRGLPGGGFARFDVGGFPRVADVEAADFDGDGDLDLVVAAFGARKVGHIALLENRTTDWSLPAFVPRRLDARPGAIHVPPADLNGDGRMDFVALIAQHHETVVAFLGEGSPLGFRTETIYSAPHPNWGSSGIQLADLDRDGDLDVLLAHGDMSDDDLLKPYHGIERLENRGRFPFTAHHLAALNGAHRALAADLDMDGDLDVVASAFVPGPAGAPEARLASLVWLSQVKRGRFERRTLEAGAPRHATIDVGDYDLDGDADIVVGNFTAGDPAPAWVEIWENLTVRRPPVSAVERPGKGAVFR
jgi:hypothetical protein